MAFLLEGFSRVDFTTQHGWKTRALTITNYIQPLPVDLQLTKNRVAGTGVLRVECTPLRKSGRIPSRAAVLTTLV